MLSPTRIKQHEVERAQKWAKMAKSKEANGEVMHYFDWTPKVAPTLHEQTELLVRMIKLTVHLSL